MHEKIANRWSHRAALCSSVLLLVLGVSSARVGLAAIITIDDVVQAEGNAGNTPFVFEVTATISLEDSEGAAAVNYQTVDITAIGGATNAGGADYQITSGILNFSCTAPCTDTEHITVNVFGDLTPEADELFRVNLTNNSNADCSALESKCSGLGTIVNDDFPASAVPEPATLLLLATAIAGVAAVRRRGRQG